MNLQLIFIQGMMWTAGHYPFNYKKDHEKAWKYYSYAAQKGQIDSKIIVAYYTAFVDHPFVQRDPRISAMYDKKCVSLNQRNLL